MSYACAQTTDAELMPIGKRAFVLRGFALPHADEVLAALSLGWTTDRRGYRYTRMDPMTEKPWPAMPPAFRELAAGAALAAGFPGFAPDACLVNRYVPGDVAVWGGEDRLRFHGVMALKGDAHPLLGHERINLTFRKAA